MQSQWATWPTSRITQTTRACRQLRLAGAPQLLTVIAPDRAHKSCDGPHLAGPEAVRVSCP
jgi:lipopolysaccharide/colanic/teichoic acid biosynthesis glycosyltransferase